MSELTISRKNPKRVNTLKVNIGKDSFEIPLGECLTLKDAKLIETFEGTVEYFNRFIPDDIIETLTIDEYNQITRAWIIETQKASGKTPGES